MNCKVCKNPLLKDDKGLYINKSNKRYGICNACWERMQTENVQKAIETETPIDITKTTLLKTINFLQLIGFIIMAIISWNAEETLQGFIYLMIGFVTFAFIKGFADIIDLLDSINDKLDDK